MGTLTMPTGVGLIAGARHADAAKRLIDYLESPAVERKLIELQFAKWSVRQKPGEGGVKAMPVDYAKAAEAYAVSSRRATALLEGAAAGVRWCGGAGPCRPGAGTYSAPRLPG